MSTLPNGQKPPGCPAWWPFGVVAKPPSLRAIQREIVKTMQEAPL